MSNEQFLRLTLSWDEYGSGELTASAAANGFSGLSSAWVAINELRIFASALEAYPLPTINPPSFMARYFMEEKEGDTDQVSIHLFFYPIGSLGRLGVHVILAPPFISGERPESRHRAELEIETTYQQLGDFARELHHLAQGEATEAVLGDWIEP